MAEERRASGPSPDRTDADFQAVVEEIRAEAQRRREAGDYPAALERELDALFEDLVPERLNEHDFEAVLDRAERASLIDLHAPIEDERRLYSQVKRGVQKLILWYMDYVVRQLATFAASTTRAVRLLGDRVEHLEREQETLARRLPDIGDELELLTRDLPTSAGTPEAWAATITDLLAGCTGRVLHAEAGDGGLVKRLLEAGIDAYGVDPLAPEDTLSLRAAGAIDHMYVVGSASLAGLVLSGVVDRATTPAKIGLAAQAADALAPGGRLALVSTDPDAWARAVPDSVADLAPGRPFHPATWHLLFERNGFDDIEVRRAEGDATSYLVTAVRPIDA